MNYDQAERLIAAMERIATAGEQLAPVLQVMSECFGVMAAQGAAGAGSGVDLNRLLEDIGKAADAAVQGSLAPIALTRNP